MWKCVYARAVRVGRNAAPCDLSLVRFASPEFGRSGAGPCRQSGAVQQGSARYAALCTHVHVRSCDCKCFVLAVLIHTRTRLLGEYMLVGSSCRIAQQASDAYRRRTYHIYVMSCTYARVRACTYAYAHVSRCARDRRRSRVHGPCD